MGERNIVLEIARIIGAYASSLLAVSVIALFSLFVISGQPRGDDGHLDPARVTSTWLWFVNFLFPLVVVGLPVFGGIVSAIMLSIRLIKPIAALVVSAALAIIVFGLVPVLIAAWQGSLWDDLPLIAGAVILMAVTSISATGAFLWFLGVTKPRRIPVRSAPEGV